MAVAVVNSSHADNVAPSTGIAKPTGTLDGHFVALAIATSDQTTVTPAGSGWNTIIAGGQAVGTTWKLWVFTRIAASDPASYTWSGGGQAWVDCVTFSGNSATAASNATPTSGQWSVAGTITMTGITTATDGAMLVAFGGSTGNSNTYSAWASPLTEGSDLGGSAWASGIQATHGASGNKTFTAASGTTGAWIFLAIGPTTGNTPIGQTVQTAWNVAANTPGSTIPLVKKAVGSITRVTSSPCAPAVPTSAQYDLCVALYFMEYSVAPTSVTGPNGWTPVTESPFAGGSTTRIYAYWLNRGAGAPSSPSFAWSGGTVASVAGFVLLFTGHDQTTPFGTAVSGAGTTSPGATVAPTANLVDGWYNLTAIMSVSAGTAIALNQPTVTPEQLFEGNTGGTSTAHSRIAMFGAGGYATAYNRTRSFTCAATQWVAASLPIRPATAYTVSLIQELSARGTAPSLTAPVALTNGSIIVAATFLDDANTEANIITAMTIGGLAMTRSAEVRMGNNRQVALWTRMNTSTTADALAKTGGTSRGQYWWFGEYKVYAGYVVHSGKSRPNNTAGTAVSGATLPGRAGPGLAIAAIATSGTTSNTRPNVASWTRANQRLGAVAGVSVTYPPSSIADGYYDANADATADYAFTNSASETSAQVDLLIGPPYPIARITDISETIISQQTGKEISAVTFQCNVYVDAWRVRLNSTTEANGTLVASGTNLTANTPQTVSIDASAGALNLAEAEYSIQVWVQFQSVWYRSRDPNRFGISRAELLTADQIAEAIEKNCGWMMVPCFWDRLQSSQGGALSTTELANIRDDLVNITAGGGHPVLEIAAHYPPTWVAAASQKFTAQDASTWTGGAGSGYEVYDYIWDATTRGFLQDFIEKLFTTLDSGIPYIDPAKIGAVRLGGCGLWFGELHYPPDGYVSALSDIKYWGFSPAAQGTGGSLASGMQVCPLPGYIPFGASETDPNNATWVNWYLDALVRYMEWQIALVREYLPTAPIYVLHPDWGMRTDRSLPTHKLDVTYRRQIAAGTDWPRQIAAYSRVTGIYPWSTWLDDSRGTPWTNDSDKPAWKALLDYATTYGKAGMIMGENASGVDNVGMDRIFTDATQGAVPNGYIGVMWIDWAALITPTGDTRANWYGRTQERPS